MFKYILEKNGYCNRPASLMKLLQKKCLVSDMCAGPVPQNQIYVMVNMSADPMTMMAWLLVWCKWNRHSHWPRHACKSSLTVPGIPVSRVQFCNTYIAGAM